MFHGEKMGSQMSGGTGLDGLARHLAGHRYQLAGLA